MLRSSWGAVHRRQARPRPPTKNSISSEWRTWNSHSERRPKTCSPQAQTHTYDCILQIHAYFLINVAKNKTKIYFGFETSALCGVSGDRDQPDQPSHAGVMLLGGISFCRYTSTTTGSFHYPPSSYVNPNFQASSFKCGRRTRNIFLPRQRTRVFTDFRRSTLLSALSSQPLWWPWTSWMSLQYNVRIQGIILFKTPLLQKRYPGGFLLR